MAFINLVGVKLPPEKADTYDEWCTGTHIPEAMKFKGIRKATRYRVAGTSKGTPGVNELTIIGAKEGYPSFITIFEFDSAEDFQKYEASPEFAAAQRDWFARKRELKVEAFWRAQFESIASWER